MAKNPPDVPQYGSISSHSGGVTKRGGQLTQVGHRAAKKRTKRTARKSR